MATCDAPISEQTLIDYWANDLADGDETDRLEAHLFACGDCSARLEQLAALGPALATLLREGRIAGIISRTILNRLQREGAHVRMFSLVPGETVPCAIFPGDDLVVTALRADFSGIDALTLSVTKAGGSLFAQFEDVPVPGAGGEVLWATPAAVVKAMPSMRLEISLASTGATGAEIGRYVLEHQSST
ncbi:MAG TPA: hypothetical protein VF128_02095 [Gemmatimonadaceae bacterium]